MLLKLFWLCNIPYKVHSGKRTSLSFSLSLPVSARTDENQLGFTSDETSGITKKSETRQGRLYMLLFVENAKYSINIFNNFFVLLFLLYSYRILKYIFFYRICKVWPFGAICNIIFIKMFQPERFFEFKMRWWILSIKLYIF